MAVRAVSSAAEHCIHIARVTGSNPVPPILPNLGGKQRIAGELVPL